MNSPPTAGQPVSVRTTAASTTTPTPMSRPGARRDDHTVEYSDGFGRLLQTRTQGENERFGHPLFGGAGAAGRSGRPEYGQGDRRRHQRQPRPPNVVVSGWQVYDNKGRVVEKYEPFFSEGWAYAPVADNERGR